MRTTIVFLLGATLSLAADQSAPPKWPAPKATAIPEADGYVDIPNVAVPPEKGRVYRAVFDATHGADKPDQLVPALNMAGSELNALAAVGAPLTNAKFVVAFHGAAMNGILIDAAYKAKYGVGNPNLTVLREMKKAGVELYVCGQNLAFDHVDPRTIAPEVQIASDALIVLMKYQNDGYAILRF